MERIWIGLGALAGLGAVAMAAFAAHAGISPDAERMVQSAVQMQGWHALALLFTGLWVSRGGILAQLAGLAFSVGLLAFCGAVYALALRNLHLGSIAPAGGMMLMLGWVLLSLSALRRHG